MLAPRLRPSIALAIGLLAGLLAPLALGVPAVRAQPAAARRVVATAAHVDHMGETTRLVFDLSAPVAASAFVLADPDRVVVDLPEVEFRLDPTTGRSVASRRRHRTSVAAGLIDSFRFGLLSAGKSRIVVDLTGPAKVVRVAAEGRVGGATLVLDLVKTDRVAFRAAARDPRTEAPPPGPVVAALGAPLTERPLIVIDPGHGGVDSGAMVNGLVEKVVVFDFAKMLAAKLQATGRFKILMTRTDDVFIPLGERVRLARAANARLFVSIHADTVSEGAPEVTGATVYTASERASDVEAARLADKENQADAAAGAERAEDATDVNDILFDLTRRETRAFSHVFARTLVNYWKVAGRLNKNPERSAGFRVLKAPDVPSVLLELGYLSNNQDAAALAAADWREKATDQVASAIGQFFDDRGPEAVATVPEPVVSAARGPLRGSVEDVSGSTQGRDFGGTPR